MTKDYFLPRLRAIISDESRTNRPLDYMDIDRIMDRVEELLKDTEVGNEQASKSSV